MTASQSLKIYHVLVRHFKNDEDARVVVEGIEQIVSDKFSQERKELSTKTEVEHLRKDVEALKIELSGKIETASLRVENNLKSEINKLIIWIVATMFGTGALFIAIAKVFFR